MVAFSGIEPQANFRMRHQKTSGSGRRADVVSHFDTADRLKLLQDLAGRPRLVGAQLRKAHDTYQVEGLAQGR